MNKDRRAQIADAIEQLEQAKGTLETCQEEEQSYFDEMPEGFQLSERGERAEVAAGLLEDVVAALEEAIDQAGEASE